MTSKFITHTRILAGALIVILATGAVAPAKALDTDALKSAAAAGDTAAQRKLGEALVFGSEGVAQDVAQGLKLLGEAAAAGDAQARASLGKILIDGYYTGAQPERAQRLLEQAANAGNRSAQMTLGEALLWGQNLTPNPPRAKTLLQAAAKAGDPEARRILGEQLVGGWVLEPDVEAGLALLEQAVAAGDDKAMVSLGGFLLNDTGAKLDVSRAQTLFEEAAKAGNGEGLERYGTYLMWSNRSPAQAEDYLRRAGEMGRGSAWSTLAEGAMYGYLGGGSRSKFDGYAEKARAAGEEVVAVLEAERLMWGISMRASGPEAIAVLEKAADDGNATAASHLIALVRDGNDYNVRKQPEQARAYLERYAPLLDPDRSAQFAYTIDAASTRQFADFPELKAVYDSHPEWRSLWFGKQIYAANANLAIYIVQLQMKDEGLYTGTVNAFATETTLRAMWRACHRLPDATRCDDSVMHPDVVGALLAR